MILVGADSRLGPTRRHLPPRATQDWTENPSERSAGSPKRLPPVSTPETQGGSERTCPQLRRTLATISLSQKFSRGGKRQYPLNRAALTPPTPAPLQVTLLQTPPFSAAQEGPQLLGRPSSARYSHLEHRKPPARGLSQAEAPKVHPALQERGTRGSSLRKLPARRVRRPLVGRGPRAPQS